MSRYFAELLRARYYVQPPYTIKTISFILSRSDKQRKKMMKDILQAETLVGDS